jgi:hypothetical protein
VPTEPIRYQPARAEIENLIRAAGQHPLGVEYLVHGHLGTVAITFGCHAFTVVAARERLAADDTARRAS